MKLNRKWILAIALVLSMAMATGGTLAYLTDRDSAVNVFTIGNVEIDLHEDFGQGATLIPGVEIEKKPVITNTGKTDAWVWLTFSIPSALDNFVQGTEQGSNENTIHWNPLGATTEGYVNDTRVTNAIAAGHLPAGITAEKILAENMTWNVFNSLDTGKNAYTEKINGVDYNTYVLLYNKALKPGETTLPSVTKVFLDAHVDIDPDGNMYRVVNGTVTDLKWNIGSQGNPIIYVSAYALQADGNIITVKQAYELYGEQWGDNGKEYGTPATTKTVSDSAELKAAVEAVAAGETAIINLENGEYTTNFKVPGGTNVVITGNKGTVLNGQIATTASNAGTLTLRGVTYNVDSISDSTGISQTGKSAIAIWGDQTVICENVTFNMSVSDSTAITSWWDTGVGTSIVVKNCTFNCNGQRPIRATGNVTVENTTFNDPYRYAVQLTAKTSTATLLDKAIVNFNNNKIVNGENGKAFVYGLQLEGADYGCHDLVINGTGNTIENGGTESTMYYCECGKVDHGTIEWNVEVTPVHEQPSNP